MNCSIDALTSMLILLRQAVARADMLRISRAASEATAGQQISEALFEKRGRLGVGKAWISADRLADDNANGPPPRQDATLRQDRVQAVDGDRYHGDAQLARQQANASFERLQAAS